MARVRLNLPETFRFSTEMAVRIGDINYGGHLDNAALLTLLHEARVRFLAQYGLAEQDVFGAGLIMADSVLVYKSEAVQGETLRIEVAVDDLSQYGCDFLYRVTEKLSDREVARAKTGMVFFDYRARRIQRTPDSFQALFGQRSVIV